MDVLEIKVCIRFLLAFYIDFIHDNWCPIKLEDMGVVTQEGLKLQENLKKFLQYFISFNIGDENRLNYQDVENIGKLSDVVDLNLRKLCKNDSDYNSYTLCCLLLQSIIITGKLSGRAMRAHNNNKRFAQTVQPIIFEKSAVVLENFLQNYGVIPYINKYGCISFKNHVKRYTKVMIEEIRRNLFIDN